MNLNLKGLLGAELGQTVWVCPVRRERYQEPRYKHWWQGWLDVRRHWAVDDDGEPAGRYWTWKGPRLDGLYRTETHWDESYNPNTGDERVWSWETREFCGWRELLRPVNNRHRDVEVTDCGVEAAVTVETRGLQIADIWFNGKDGNPPAPTGSIIGITVRAGSGGELLWTADFPQPRDVEADDDLLVTGSGMSIS